MVKSPLRWVGGKNAEAEYLAGLLPVHLTYIEVFGGGASVLLAKRPSPTEVFNDSDGELINFFRVVKERLEGFVARWRWALVSREEFDRLKAADPADMDEVDRAYRFLYLNRASFSGEMANPSFGTSARARSELVPAIEELEMWTDALHRRLLRAYIEHLDWRQLLEVWGNGEEARAGKVFFLDPPYLATQGYATGTMSLQDHTDLATALGKITGRFLMTVNDHPNIRPLYSGCFLEERAKQYSISRSAEGRKGYGELVISNYELPLYKQGSLF